MKDQLMTDQPKSTPSPDGLDIARCLETIEGAYNFLSGPASLKNCGEWKYLKRLLPSPLGTGASESVALANALEKLDWSNTSIENKALIQHAIIILRATPAVSGEAKQILFDILTKYYTKDATLDNVYQDLKEAGILK